MKDEMNLTIKNFGPITEADIDIGRINVIGGLNATGKSTASKLLYSFLRSSFSKRGDFAYEKLKREIRQIIVNIYGKLGILKPEYVDERRLANAKIDYYSFFLENKDNFERNFDDLSLLEKYLQAKLDYNDFNRDIPLKKFIDQDIKEIDGILDIIQENGNPLFISLLRTILKAEFSSTDFNFISSFKGIKNSNKFKFSVDFNDYDLTSDDAFSSDGNFEIEDVFYIDSFSLFETSKPWRDTNTHVGYIKKMLNEINYENQDLFDEKVNKTIINIENTIKDIIDGEIIVDKGRFYFTNENLKPIDMQNTASGIKQIGIIQLLLANRKLKEDCFLIIDEPEVNLHPEWQIKLAKILVILAKELNIAIYINTHSPMFIEAMSLYSEYYDLLEDTNVYLTENHDFGGFTFKKINPKDMGAVYENLSRPYDDLDEIKSEILLRK